MNGFSSSEAWSKGIALVTGDAGRQALILIGMGLVLPTAIQFAIYGSMLGTMTPAAMGMGGADTLLAAGSLIFVVLAVTYLLQFGSYFASWRAGLAGERESLGGAVAYGMVAALVLILFVIVVVIVIALLATASPTIGTLIALLLMLPLFAIVYAGLAATMAVGMVVGMLLAAAFGAALPGTDLTAMAGAGAAMALVIVGLFAFALLWVTARLGCTLCAMADARSFNIFAGMAESWRRTSHSQWRILGYLALVGLAAAVLFIAVLAAVGASLGASFAAGATPEPSAGLVIGGIVGGIFMAYFIVIVPAGIYRAVAVDTPEDVFA